MEEKLDLSKYSIRTDLAIEARDIAIHNQKLVQDEQDQSQLDGVIIKEKEENGIKMSYVEVTEKGEEIIGKKKGKYLTIEVLGIRQQDSSLQEQVEKVFAQEFSQFLKQSNIKENDACLIVGLGNWNVTPDALGPKVCENVLVTRQLYEL